MAGDACEGEVRIEERLKIKIAEAKNLPPRSHGPPTHRDTYCVLSLDQEPIFKTCTIERTLNPFFVEEFQFINPRTFRHLCIYVFERDKDRHLKPDKPLGKVAIRREELQTYNNKDYWFALRPVDADSEVQGKAHIEILFEESFPKITSISPDYHQQDASSPKVPHRNMELSDGGRSPLTEMTGSNLSVDRKVSKSKKISEYCKESIKFGSCSSTSSKKLLSAVNIAENLSGLARSESLRSAGLSAQSNQSLHHTYGPSSSSRNKQISMNAENLRSQQSLNTFIPSDTYVHPSLESDYSPDYNPYPSVDQSPSEGQIPQADLKNKISIKVLECSELTKKNGQCDPYAVVTVVYSNDKKVSKRTRVKKKTVNPRFEECFLFDLIDSDNSSSKDRSSGSNNAYTVSGWTDAVACEVCVTVWHDGPGGHNATFLGEVRASLRTTPHPAALNTSAWYCLRSRSASQQSPRAATPSGTRLSSMAGPASLGSLRLHLLHTLDRVLPPLAYDRLKTLLLKNPKPITSSAVYILGEIVASKTDAAQPLVRLLTNEDKLVPNIKALADAELATLLDATTIFRGNTLVSKMMDEAMRLTGITYLQQTVKPVLDIIMAEKKVCEIDPTRVKDQTAIESNLANLKDYVEKMFSAITTSFLHCPAIMSRLFDVLRQCAAQRFPNNPDVKYSVVSGFIFLRFFAPAILGPRLFDLTTEQIDPQTNRTLTLISKTIQSLGNLTSSQACKEEYMMALYTSFSTESHIQAIKNFLDIVSSRICEKPNTHEIPVVLKEGTMMKKAQGRKRFGRANLKKRHFKLTSCELSYSKARGKKPLCSIPLTEIDTAEPVPDAQNLKMNNMFQITSKDRILFVQANNSVERKEWLYLLGKLCEGNTPAPERHHPGTYSHSRWTCCLSDKSDAIGCVVNEGAVSPSSPPHPPNLRLHLDPARDLQRIHCLLYSNLNLIENLLRPPRPGCQPPALTASVPIEELPQYRATLRELQEVTFCLEEQHRVYQRLVARKTQLGSKQAPIGDDNYLNLGARPNMSLDSQQMTHMTRPFRMLHSATAPTLHSTSPPSSRHFVPYASPSLPPKLEKVKPVPPLSVAPEKGFAVSHPRELNLQCPVKNSLSDKIFANTDSTYLNNSLYNSSSMESMKIQDGEDKVNCRLSTSSTSGYLKMSSLSRNEDCCEESKVTKIRISPTQELGRKDRISPLVPEQKPATLSEYVEVRPKVPERDTKPIVNPVIPPKTMNKAKAVTPEEQIEYPQYSCAEYELMSNFSSVLKSRHTSDDAKIDDTPPAVPPRSHHSTPIKFLPKTTAPKHSDDVDDILLQEYKSLEQYQLKTEACSDSSKRRVTTLRIVEDGDDEVEERGGRRKEEVTTQAVRSQNICDSNVENSDCNNLRLSQCNVTNVDSEQCKWTHNQDSASCSGSSNKEQCQSVAASSVNDDIATEVQAEESTNKKQKNKEDGVGFFSRKNVQRKSIPKSKSLSTSSGESSLSAPSRRSDPTEPTKSGLTDRLTPSFFKKKTKVTTSTDNVRLPPIC